MDQITAAKGRVTYKSTCRMCRCNGGTLVHVDDEHITHIETMPEEQEKKRLG